MDTDALYVAGETSSILQAGPTDEGQPYFGGKDMFLAKFTAVGALDWLRIRGAPGDQVASAVVVDPVDESVYYCGYTQSSVDGEPYLGGSTDAVLVKTDPQGNHFWTRHFGGNGSDYCTSLAVNGETGDIFLIGYSDSPSTMGTMMGNFPSYNSGGLDVLIASFDSEGTILLYVILSL